MNDERAPSQRVALVGGVAIDDAAMASRIVRTALPTRGLQVRERLKIVRARDHTPIVPLHPELVALK